MRVISQHLHVEYPVLSWNQMITCNLQHLIPQLPTSRLESEDRERAKMPNVPG